MAIAEQFELEPKDMVYVSPSALANWHRKLSLIFPSGLTSAIGAAKP
jgi:polysaccharide export outer membrane protein